VHDFLHSDLHCGNWKIDISEDDPKIVVYDCGIFTETGDKDMNKSIIHHISNSKYSNLVDIFPYSQGKTEKLKEEIEVIDCDKTISPHTKITLVLKSIVNSDVTLISSLVRMIQALGISGKDMDISASKAVMSTPDDKNSVNFFVYMALSYNTKHFIKLYEFYRDWIQEDEEHTKSTLDWLKCRYNHTDLGVFLESVCEIFDLEFNKNTLHFLDSPQD